MFEKSELGRMKKLLPLHAMAENFGLVSMRFPVDTRSVIPVIPVHSGDNFNMVLQS